MRSRLHAVAAAGLLGTLLWWGESRGTWSIGVGGALITLGGAAVAYLIVRHDDSD